MNMEIFSNYESEVRSYSRNFPTVFTKAKGYKLWDTDGKEYIDFFAGAGTLNYGHNNDSMKKLLLEYIENDHITHSLDMASTARGEFLKKFNEVILEPRKMDFKVMFPGPTGTNAVESALKLARKVKKRTNIMSFTNAFHGMTIGALAVTGNAAKRGGAGIPLANAVSMPFDKFISTEESLNLVEKYLENESSGVDLPAAIILETVQGEGGINAASKEWLQGIEKIARKFDILLIIDDIQAGCGRTGTFFSFEEAGIEPDIVTLSKSLGGYGLPMAITIFKRELDVWNPGEHNGTFRGNNLAFVAATEALSYWENNDLGNHVKEMAKILHKFVDNVVENYPELNAEPRGRGLMQGIACHVDGIAPEITSAAFERGLIMETSGADDEVVKFLTPLIIDEAGLKAGLEILEEAIQVTLEKRKTA